MFVYRIFTIFFAPLVLGALLLRQLRGIETRQQTAERFGGGAKIDRKNSTVIWVHGASLGEMTAARPFLERLIGEIDDLVVVATVNTTTARELVCNWEIPAITARLAPVDYAFALHRFWLHWQPNLAVNLENEVWPLRMQFCTQRDVPFVVVGGRVSEKSFTLWSRVRKLSKSILATITYLAPSDAMNETRFLQLGVAPERIGRPISLKSAVELKTPDIVKYESLQRHFKREQTYLAASTHPGDEEMVLGAFCEALRSRPDIKLIVAPRHPQRGDEIAQVISKIGMNFSRRSLGHEPRPDDSVLLADTIGEMPLWYSLAKITIVGGTFSNFGGHTPVEPVQFGSIVVHGNDVANNTEAFSALGKENASVLVAGQADLQTIFENREPNLGHGNICKRAQIAMQSFRAEKSDTTEVIEEILKLVSASR